MQERSGENERQTRPPDEHTHTQEQPRFLLFLVVRASGVGRSSEKRCLRAEDADNAVKRRIIREEADSVRWVVRRLVHLVKGIK